MNSGQLVRPSIDMEDNTWPTAFSDSEPSDRVFSTQICTKVSGKKKKKQNQVETTVASNEQQLLVLQLTCSMSSCILLSLFLPLLTSVGRKFLLWWYGNGTSSLKLGAASKSSHISCVPLWNIFASSKLAGCFQRAEFSPCRWEGSQDLEMTF